MRTRRAASAGLRVSISPSGLSQAAWRTPEASRLIASADELVGYGFYIGWKSDFIGKDALAKMKDGKKQG